MLCNNCLPLLPFQSTHPCGVRLTDPGITGYRVVVSIHAPLRGATGCGWILAQRHISFNPRTPAGCDRPRKSLNTLDGRFNPRTSAGCDQESFSRGGLAWSFNPRTPAGCDVARGGHYLPWPVSIHAPLRGATLKPRTSWPCMKRFNPRTPAGCDYLSPARWSAHRGFNPRTPAGCDQTVEKGCSPVAGKHSFGES